MIIRIPILLLALAFFTPAALAQQARYAVEVDGLSCPFCSYGVEKQLSRLEGVTSAETQLKEGVVIVTMENGRTLEQAQVTEAVKKAGFTLRGFSRINGPGRNTEDS